MDVPKGDFRWIAVGSKSQPGVQIVLSNYIQGSPDDLSYVAGLVAKVAFNAVHFRTDDLDGLFVKLAEAGAEIVSEPTSQPWGARDGAVRDPSGNLIRIADYDVFTKRQRVPVWEKLLVALRTVIAGPPVRTSAS